MNKLTWDLKQLCHRNRDGSYATQAERSKILTRAAGELKQLGFSHLRAGSLKPKHVEALIKHWQTSELAVGTIKNRMSHLRWWAEKVNKPGVIANDNVAYGLENRQFVTNEDKSLRNIDPQMEKIDCPYVRCSLQLQRAFGLRREEAMKFKPAYADKGDKLILKPSWCKGSRAREIPIRTPEQREALQQAHHLAKKGSLIPSDKKYVEQKNVFEYQTTKAGISKTHGLRHAYAQDRYQELTGWAARARGGPKYSELNQDEKRIDTRSRLQISEELGHERLQITSAYLGGRSG